MAKKQDERTKSKKFFKLLSRFVSIIICVELGRLIKVQSKNGLFFMHFATQILYYHAITTCERVGWKLKIYQCALICPTTGTFEGIKPQYWGGFKPKAIFAKVKLQNIP